MLVFQASPLFLILIENIVDATIHIMAEILTAIVVPAESAKRPRSELPNGVVPKNTNAYTLIALPLRLSGTESWIKLFAVARRLTRPHPVNIRAARER